MIKPSSSDQRIQRSKRHIYRYDILPPFQSQGIPFSAILEAGNDPSLVSTFILIVGTLEASAFVLQLSCLMDHLGWRRDAGKEPRGPPRRVRSKVYQGQIAYYKALDCCYARLHACGHAMMPRIKVRLTDSIIFN